MYVEGRRGKGLKGGGGGRKGGKKGFCSTLSVYLLLLLLLVGSDAVTIYFDSCALSLLSPSPLLLLQTFLGVLVGLV